MPIRYHDEKKLQQRKLQSEARTIFWGSTEETVKDPWNTRQNWADASSYCKKKIKMIIYMKQ